MFNITGCCKVNVVDKLAGNFTGGSNEYTESVDVDFDNSERISDYIRISYIIELERSFELSLFLWCEQ